MKKTLFILLITFIGFSAFTQNRSVKTITDFNKSTEKIFSNEVPIQKEPQITKGNAEILWQINEQYAIGGDVIISESNKIALTWNTNDQYAALYEDSNIPIWKIDLIGDYDINCNLRSNKLGNLYLIIGETTVKVVDENGNIINTLNLGAYARGSVVASDGEGFYIAYSSGNNSIVQFYNKTEESPVWETEIIGNVVEMNIDDNNTRIVVPVSAPDKKMYVLDPETGEILQDDIYYYSNSPTQAPALSANAEYLAFADFTGYATLLHWENDKYEQVWRTSVSYGEETSTWGSGIAISKDGSYIAIGTLGFVPSGYAGRVFLFNNYSPNPIWIYTDVGDEVSNIDMSDDGSLIACATYGPMDHSTSDFFVFRKQSNVPLIELNTPGSLEYVDMNGDGSLCITSGKAVHVREMGWGGNAYCIYSTPTNSGTISGTITLNGSNDNSGVKVSLKDIDDYYEFTNEDGNYKIKYIPEGTYNVKISKVGYEPIEYNEIVVEAGEITTLDGILEPMGEPITNLYASKGSDLTVKLRWDNYNNNCDGYAIYRKESLQDYFGEPIGFVDQNINTYNDESALPTINYYYAVTAILDDDKESPFSNIDLGYVSTNYITRVINAYEGTEPIVDGIINEDEWNDSFILDASDFLGASNEIEPIGTVTVYVKVSGSRLYLALKDISDTQLSEGDCISLYIDNNNDKQFPEEGDDSEGNYWFKFVNNEAEVTYRPIYKGGSVGSVIPVPSAELAFSDVEGYVTLELSLEFGDEPYMITPSEDNNSGLYFYYRSDGDDYHAYWPHDNLDTFNPIGYNTINYFAESSTPLPPENLRINDSFIESSLFVPIIWDMPEINDFDHFNVYINSDEVSCEVLGTEVVLDVEENTDYSVYVTTVDRRGNESEPSEILTFNTTNIEDNKENETNIIIYPNPAKTIVNIETELNGKSNIYIIDIAGKFIKQTTINDSKYFSIDVSNLKSGVYFITIKQENFIAIKKIIIE